MRTALLIAIILLVLSRAANAQLTRTVEVVRCMQTVTPTVSSTCCSATLPKICPTSTTAEIYASKPEYAVYQKDFSEIRPLLSSAEHYALYQQSGWSLGDESNSSTHSVYYPALSSVFHSEVNTFEAGFDEYQSRWQSIVSTDSTEATNTSIPTAIPPRYALYEGPASASEAIDRERQLLQRCRLKAAKRVALLEKQVYRIKSVLERITRNNERIKIVDRLKKAEENRRREQLRMRMLEKKYVRLARRRALVKKISVYHEEMQHLRAEVVVQKQVRRLQAAFTAYTQASSKEERASKLIEAFRLGLQANRAAFVHGVFSAFQKRSRTRYMADTAILKRIIGRHARSNAEVGKLVEHVQRQIAIRNRMFDARIAHLQAEIRRLMEEDKSPCSVNVIARRLQEIHEQVQHWERVEHQAAIAWYRWVFRQYAKLQAQRDQRSGVVRPADRHDGWGPRCPSLVEMDRLRAVLDYRNQQLSRVLGRRIGNARVAQVARQATLQQLVVRYARYTLQQMAERFSDPVMRFLASAYSSITIEQLARMYSVKLTLEQIAQRIGYNIRRTRAIRQLTAGNMTIDEFARIYGRLTIRQLAQMSGDMTLRQLAAFYGNMTFSQLVQRGHYGKLTVQQLALIARAIHLQTAVRRSILLNASTIHNGSLNPPPAPSLPAHLTAILTGNFRADVWESSWRAIWARNWERARQSAGSGATAAEIRRLAMHLSRGEAMAMKCRAVAAHHPLYSPAVAFGRANVAFGRANVAFGGANVAIAASVDTPSVPFDPPTYPDGRQASSSVWQSEWTRIWQQAVRERWDASATNEANLRTVMSLAQCRLKRLKNRMESF